MRAIELAVGESSCRDLVIARGTDSSALADEDTIEGVKFKEVVVSGEPDRPAC